jgi:radical SAM superfamily enzyme YgiQ (UPF0313 family)
VLSSLAGYGAREIGRVGFVGAAVSDHPDLGALIGEILDAGGQCTVSSFRAESLDARVLALLARGGLKTLTVALEAGSERLRARLGKTITEEGALRAAQLAAAAGIENLRIYAMVGLPGEEDADVEALADLTLRAHKALGGGLVTVSVAPFVPKPHTPFQWEAMAPEPVLRARIRHLERLLRAHRGVKAVAEAPKWARVQGLLSRGGRGVAPLLEKAAATGAWRELLRTAEAESVLDRERASDEAFPWDFLGGMPSRGHLWGEAEKSRLGAPPRACRPGTCAACEVCRT